MRFTCPSSCASVEPIPLPVQREDQDAQAPAFAALAESTAGPDADLGAVEREKDPPVRA